MTLEAAESLPGWEEVVLAHQAGLSAVSEAEADMLRAAEAGQVGWDEVQAVVGPEIVRRWQVRRWWWWWCVCVCVCWDGVCVGGGHRVWPGLCS